MQKVILKFIGTGINDKYQACVNIYDTNGNLLYQKKTYNGELVLYLKKNKLYKLEAESFGDIIKTFFYVNKSSEYVFFFKRSIVTSNLRIITFLLNDANYNNLPIEKGEIILWQKQ